MAAGVSKGPLFGQLHHVVRSANCVFPTIAATGVANVACPSLAYLPVLVDAPQFAKYRVSTTADDHAGG